MYGSPKPTCSARSTRAGRSSRKCSRSSGSGSRGTPDASGYSRLAPTVLDDRWEDLPEELRGRWVRMIVHCRRARLLAYRVVALQNAGRVQPGDTAAYRIAVTTPGPGQRRSADGNRRGASPRRGRQPILPRRSGGPLAVLAGLHRVVRRHRDAADPAVARLLGALMNLDLSEEAKEFGREARGRSSPPVATNC